MKYIPFLVVVNFISFAITSVVAGPNVIPDVRNFSIVVNYEGNQHEIDDDCIPPGPHNVLRFDFVLQNIGNADFVIGRPIDQPDLFYYSIAHQHYHMKQFNQYKLYDTGGNLVVPSLKPGFCLADVERLFDNAVQPQFSLTCASDQVMGISVGWADVYYADLDCQFLVMDGVPDGDYTLVATANTAKAVPEDSFDDNTVCRGLHIEGNTVYELDVLPIFLTECPYVAKTLH